MYTSDLWHGEEWKLITWQATEHMNITKHVYWRIFFRLSAKCTNVAYISANVNIVKISILIVSRQRHSSWNRLRAAVLNALDVLKLCYNSEWEPLQTTQRVRQRTERIIQTDSQTYSLLCQLLLSSLWTELSQKNESFANGHRSLPREK